MHFMHSFLILRRMKEKNRQFFTDQSLYLKIFVLSIFLLFFGCLRDVPHSNPLDPQNSNGTFVLSGKVFTYYQPRTPISSVQLLLEPGSHIARTSDDGSFIIKGIKGGTYVLHYGADGYQHDSLAMNITSNLNVDFHLNGLPYFINKTILTHHNARWFPLEDIFYLELQTSVNDPDGPGDIKNVFYALPDLALDDTLNPALETGIFSASLFEKDLSVTSLQKILGRPFYFRVEDEPGAVVVSQALYSTRIIEKTASVISPSELETVQADSINFRWQLKALPFEYTLKIDIFAINAGIPANVESIDNIAAGQQEWLYLSALVPGDYFWTVTIVDRYGNTSRSKEGVFNVP